MCACAQPASTHDARTSRALSLARRTCCEESRRASANVRISFASFPEARRLSPTSFLALKGLSAGGGALLGITFGAAFGKPLAAFSLAFGGAAVGYLVPDRLLARYAASRREA